RVCYRSAPSNQLRADMGEMQDLAALIRAGTPLIVVETADEAQAVDMFRQTLTRVWRAMYRWTLTEGLRGIDLDGEDPAEETADDAQSVDMSRQPLTRVWRAMYRGTTTEGRRRIDLDGGDPAEVAADVGTTLRTIRGADQRGVYLLLDFHPYRDYAGSQRQMRDILQRRDCLPHTLVLVGHKVELPAELESKAVRYRPRLPDAAALRRMVAEQAQAYAAEHGGRRVETDPQALERIVR